MYNLNSVLGGLKDKKMKIEKQEYIESLVVKGFLTIDKDGDHNTSPYYCNGCSFKPVDGLGTHQIPSEELVKTCAPFGEFKVGKITMTLIFT